MSAAQSPTGGRARRSRKQIEATPEAVRAAFVSCGRCSFFLVAYGLIHQDYDQAARETADGWLTLSGGDEVRKLLYKSYGVEVHVDGYYFEGLCHECRRRFVYDAGEEAGEAAKLLISVVPG